MHIDRDKLQQAVVNLITNAVHALVDERSTGKQILVSTHDLKDHFEIRISDNGVGMSDETRQQIFEPLYSTKEFGVGLGMVITKSIIEQHRGVIFIESEEGRGTTVVFRLPSQPSIDEET